MYGVRIASVWVEDIKQWVPLTQVIFIQRYTQDGKECLQFKFEDKILESYIEYKELY
jgi:hypothetical protein